MKEKLFVVEKINIKKTFTKTFYGLKDDYSIDDIKSYPVINRKIVGIFKSQNLAEQYLAKKNLNVSIKYNGDIKKDFTGGVEGKCHIKGFYHNVEEKELDTVYIVNGLYAKVKDDLIFVDETKIEKNNEFDEENEG